MKYALFILCLLTMSFSFETQARTITSFKKSQAITDLSQFLFEVSPDLPESIKISDRKLASVDVTLCKSIPAEKVLETVERAVRHVLRYFPDEEVPFEEAIYDLEDYLGHSTYFQCNIIKKTKHATIHSSYYVDTLDRIHLRLDRITPVTE